MARETPSIDRDFPGVPIFQPGKSENPTTNTLQTLINTTSNDFPNPDFQEIFPFSAFLPLGGRSVEENVPEYPAGKKDRSLTLFSGALSPKIL
jgi:hypothetical protein